MRRHDARFGVRAGERFPPGATPRPAGVNFSTFGPDAKRMALCLYERADDTTPIQTIELEPDVHVTSSYWHVFVEGAEPGLYYAWRTDASSAEILDPWARAVDAGRRRGRVVETGAYDWEGDGPLDRPTEDSVIYEMHVGGFTRGDASAVSRPGTFGAVVEKIPYLKALGITDVELMPVMAFDADDLPDGAARLGLTNFWGYSPYGFHAPHPRYAAGGDAPTEFRDMVKALHRAGIGVILDVVLNHTAEGGAGGPTIHFKSLAADVFYHMEPGHPDRYRDYSGCGNTLNCNHPVVAEFLVRCLEYWVEEMHVDGFRIDLASVLTRGEDGRPMAHPPVLRMIEDSPALRRAKLIAEPWDAAGLYQVGEYQGARWMEWNGRYRDTIRRALGGEPGMLGELATRVAGSSDLYGKNGKRPTHGVNFVTCHDGFTLWDLVSYETKRNQANGENNRDGSDRNLAWNCGVEGPTDKPGVLALRRRRARNFVAVLLLSQGVPMLLAGDEALRTQAGNNNAYCQDNPIGWFDWRRVESNAGMLRFTREIIALRLRHRALRRRAFLTGRAGTGRAGQADVVWHGTETRSPDWNDPGARVLGFTLSGQDNDEGDLRVMLNMSDAEAQMAVPSPPGHRWFRAVDTALAPPEDIAPPHDQPAFAETRYAVAPHSVVVLESRPRAHGASRTMPAKGGSVTGIE